MLPFQGIWRGVSSAPAERTEVLTDQKLVMDRALAIFSNAKNGLDILAETMAPPQSDQSQEAKNAAEAYFDIKKRGGRLRILTKIDEKNIAYCKELMKNIELRHFDDVKGNFAVSDSEYMSSPGSTTFQPNAMVTVIYSNARPLVEQNRIVFERFWNIATPAEERIKEIEEGVVQPKIEIIRDPYQIQRLYVDLVRQAKARNSGHFADCQRIPSRRENRGDRSSAGRCVRARGEGQHSRSGFPHWGDSSSVEQKD